MTDEALLAVFVNRRSADAFAQLVSRHVDMVYSATKRHVQDPGVAEDVTQEVFVALARKAASLDPEKSLASWLFGTTRLTALATRRATMRRRFHEQEAAMARAEHQEADLDWPLVATELDAAVEELSEADRQAVLLRYFSGRTHREVGIALAISEEAAKKRVQRGVEALRELLRGKGVAVPGVILAAGLSAHALEAAPAGLAGTIVAAAPGAVAAAPVLSASAKWAAIFVGVSAAVITLLLFYALSVPVTPRPVLAAAPDPATAVPAVPVAPVAPPAPSTMLTAPAGGPIRTLHMRETTYSYSPDLKFPQFTSGLLLPQEWWIDLANDRSRQVSFAASGSGANREISRNESFDSGDLSVLILHSSKRVFYSHRSLLDRRLRTRKLMRQTLDKYQNDDLKSFAKIGGEEIAGRHYDIWEHTQALTPIPGRIEAGTEMRVQAWLLPDSRQSARELVWQRPNAASDWQPSAFWGTIETNVEIPEATFQFTAPSDYRVENTPETAGKASLNRGGRQFKEAGGAGLKMYPGFTFENGAALIPWGIIEPQDIIAPPASEAVKNLKPGDELPNLPVVVPEIIWTPEVVRDDKERPYLGRHFAISMLNGETIEWVLYLPVDRRLSPPLDSVFVAWAKVTGTTGLTRFNPTYLETVGPQDFDAMVAEAMRELSDDHKVPAGMTYAEIDKLAARLLVDLPRTAPATTTPATTAPALP